MGVISSLPLRQIGILLWIIRVSQIRIDSGGKTRTFFCGNQEKQYLRSRIWIFKENQCFEEKEYFGFKLHVNGCHLSALHHYACRTQFPNHYVAPAVVTERARPDMFIVNLKDATYFFCWVGENPLPDSSRHLKTICHICYYFYHGVPHWNVDWYGHEWNGTIFRWWHCKLVCMKYLKIIW